MSDRREAQRERLRRRYRPKLVGLLFIGESPPASGRFFYQRDSGLYRAVRDAFHTADPNVTDENFLAIFRESGCYLVDACRQPVDQLDAKLRRAACLAGEPSLSRKIKTLQPEAIVTLVRSIRDNVERAAIQAKWRGEILEVPYPGRWIRHREVFLEKLVPRLRGLLKSRKAAMDYLAT